MYYYLSAKVNSSIYQNGVSPLKNDIIRLMAVPCIGDEIKISFSNNSTNRESKTFSYVVSKRLFFDLLDKDEPWHLKMKLTASDNEQQPKYVYLNCKFERTPYREDGFVLSHTVHIEDTPIPLAAIPSNAGDFISIKGVIHNHMKTIYDTVLEKRIIEVGGGWDIESAFS